MNKKDYIHQTKKEIVFVPYKWFRVWQDLDGPETTEVLKDYEVADWKAERGQIGHDQEFVADDPGRGGKYYRITFRRKTLKHLKVYIFTNHHYQYIIERIVISDTLDNALEAAGLDKDQLGDGQKLNYYWVREQEIHEGLVIKEE